VDTLLITTARRVSRPFLRFSLVRLFAGTLTFFAVAPAVTGLPALTLADPSLLKDLGLSRRPVADPVH
jgi:hypothetical protein